MFWLIIPNKPISKFDAINAVNGGPKIIQQANAVKISINDKIRSLYLLDKLLKSKAIAFMD
tara:strand:+ start:81 stop:263 length:183 start_codon:yes stop_codon:yes gene_type:complete